MNVFALSDKMEAVGITRTEVQGGGQEPRARVYVFEWTRAMSRVPRRVVSELIEERKEKEQN